MTTLSDKQLHNLARLGAIARLKELDEEAATIRKIFPGLKKAAEQAAEPARATPKPRRKRWMMSAEARKLQSERMKLYWAKKRGAAPESEGADKDQATVADAAAPVAKPKKATASSRKQKKAASPKAANRSRKA